METEGGIDLIGPGEISLQGGRSGLVKTNGKSAVGRVKVKAGNQILEETIKIKTEAKMNIEDKINLLNGKDVWHTYNIDRLNVKSIMMADGPHGCESRSIVSTTSALAAVTRRLCFPAAATAACTFYPDNQKDG